MATGKVAFVFAGQGSQYVGMGKDLCERFVVAKRIFADADDALGYSLSKLCFNGLDLELKRTENTQPAILTASIAVNSLSVGVVTNVEAEVNQDAGRVKSLLTEQAVRPVRWEESVRKLAALGCQRVLEVGPGKVLSGLIKRISSSLDTDNFESAQDLARVRGETAG